MDTHKEPVSINSAKCAPCPRLLCVGVCPQGILEPAVNHKPELTDAASCTQCGVCADMCPTKAITINRKQPQK